MLNKHVDKDCQGSCICKTLKKIKDSQDRIKFKDYKDCNESETEKIFDTVPFLLQTPYGHPFFTFGNIGKVDCFITVFFRVEKVDAEKCCAILRLLKPNKSILDKDTGSVEHDKICEVDYVTKTNDCVTIDLSCYNALKCLEPSFVRK